MVGCLICAAAPAQADVSITEFAVPAVYGVEPMTATSSAVWFAEPSENTIGRIDPTGHVTMFALPAPYEDPRGITRGPDGAVWFTQTGGHTGGEGIARIDDSGAIREYPLPPNTRPFGITTGPDGNLWFTEVGSTWRIGQLSSSTGQFTEFHTVLHSEPLNIVAGPDGALWFTEDGIVNGGVGAIGRITTSGDVTEYLLPTTAGLDSGAGDIAVGSDGNLWFTWVESSTNGAWAHSVGRITTSGAITEYSLSFDQTWPPGGIAAGPDGNLWSARNGANSIAQISTAGVVTEHPIPTAGGFPWDVVAGSDGNIWFSEAGVGKIGRINLATGSDLHQRSVSLSLSRHVIAKGTVTATEAVPACWQAQEVTIEHRVDGVWVTAADARTNTNGGFRVKLADETGAYRARIETFDLAAGDHCGPAISPRFAHRHG
jgi:virginiamycin B lyase